MRLWDTASFEQVAVLRGHSNYVHDVAVSRDGTLIASASGDRTLRLLLLVGFHDTAQTDVRTREEARLVLLAAAAATCREDVVQAHRYLDQVPVRLRGPRWRWLRDLEALVPWLYLKGISTGDFSECLRTLVGVDDASLSPSTVVRLKDAWIEEHKAWEARSLTGKRYVYVWADGVYFNIRLKGERQCILVILGATAGRNCWRSVS